jgi:hypothetical protein
MPKSAQFTITTSAQIIVPAEIGDQMAYLHNGTGGGGGGGSTPIYIGGADLTAANGYRLDNGDKLTLQVGDHTALYAVTSSGTATLYVLSQIN